MDWKYGTSSLVTPDTLLVMYRGVPVEHHVPRMPTLYDRLGGSFAIAAVVDHFSDAILTSPILGVDSPNPKLSSWSRDQKASRMPGLKFMRTLWVCDIAGGPQKYAASGSAACDKLEFIDERSTSTYHPARLPDCVPSKDRFDLSAAHKDLKISSAEFDEVARILAESLDLYMVPSKEKAEVLAAFGAHKDEVIQHCGNVRTP